MTRTLIVLADWVMQSLKKVTGQDNAWKFNIHNHKCIPCESLLLVLDFKGPLKDIRYVRRSWGNFTEDKITNPSLISSEDRQYIKVGNGRSQTYFRGPSNSLPLDVDISKVFVQWHHNSRADC